MNPNLKDLENDFLYHLGYSRSDDLVTLFGDVKVTFHKINKAGQLGGLTFHTSL